MSTPPKNRNWLWFYLLVAALTIAATTTLAVYNIRQQLKPETVREAIALWKDKGPKDYLLKYKAQKTQESGDMTDHYVVSVRGGQAREVHVNGVPLEDRQLAYYGMHRLLQDIERFMEIDSEPGKPKVFTRGIFDGKTGALAWYVRSVMKSRQRVEITVESLQLK